MASVPFPWRPLGAILVERGLIDEDQLEKALTVQRREERTLGEILVERGWVTPFGLATALAAQHGLKLDAGGDGANGDAVEIKAPEPGEAVWKPLGRLLVERGLLSEVQLKQALAEQHESGYLLGEILVNRGWVSAPAIAATVAAQHGVSLESEPGLRARLSEDLDHEARFLVQEAAEGGWQNLHTSPSFLDATDVAFDAIDDRDPQALVIVRIEGGTREIVWRYVAEEAARTRRDSLLDLYGYPSVEWHAAPWTD